jgi:hypothetical protein
MSFSITAIGEPSAAAEKIRLAPIEDPVAVKIAEHLIEGLRTTNVPEVIVRFSGHQTEHAWNINLTVETVYPVYPKVESHG